MCLACHLCVRVPRVQSDTAETHRAVALVHGVRVYCTGCGAVRESSHTFCVRALRGIHAEALLPPDPKGWISAVAAPATWTDLLGARAERVPDCSSYLSRIPGSATDSGSSVHPRDSRGSRGGRPLLAPSDARHHALLNASAADESTAAGSLKACLNKRQCC